MTVRAGQESDCTDCDVPVRPGDSIVSTPDGWAHERCPANTAATPCPRCHLVHAGECF